MKASSVDSGNVPGGFFKHVSNSRKQLLIFIYPKLPVVPTRACTCRCNSTSTSSLPMSLPSRLSNKLLISLNLWGNFLENSFDNSSMRASISFMSTPSVMTCTCAPPDLPYLVCECHRVKRLLDNTRSTRFKITVNFIFLHFCRHENNRYMGH